MFYQSSLKILSIYSFLNVLYFEFPVGGGLSSGDERPFGDRRSFGSSHSETVSLKPIVELLSSCFIGCMDFEKRMFGFVFAERFGTWMFVIRCWLPLVNSCRASTKCKSNLLIILPLCVEEKSLNIGGGRLGWLPFLGCILVTEKKHFTETVAEAVQDLIQLKIEIIYVFFLLKSDVFLLGKFRFIARPEPLLENVQENFTILRKKNFSSIQIRNASTSKDIACFTCRMVRAQDTSDPNQIRSWLVTMPRSKANIIRTEEIQPSWPRNLAPDLGHRHPHLPTSEKKTESGIAIESPYIMYSARSHVFFFFFIDA